MPLSNAFDLHPIAIRLVRVRHNPVAAYGVAVAAVAVAVLARFAVSDWVYEGLPFITLYPAIIVATLVGGFRPGILALLLATLSAWFFFVEPHFSFELGPARAAALLLFVATSAVNVALIALLNAALERVIAQEENVRVLLESAPNGIVVVNDEGKISLVNASAERLFGYPRAELLGRHVDTLVPAPQSAAHRTLREAFQRKPTARAMGAGRELSGRRKDGSEFPVEIGLSPVGQNSRTAILASVIDISERKHAAARQQFLFRELRHRSQNLFAVIQSIAARSLTEGRTLAEAKEIFHGRLLALARTHAMLADAAWEGAPLAEVVRGEFAAFSMRLHLSGCDIVVNTPAAQQFALIVHELATNAAKYGALSSAEGRVAVEGKIERMNGERLFAFVWKEHGGPPVSAPQRKGFGSVILLEAAKQFSENVALNYEPDGVRYALVVPLGAIESAPKADAGAAQGVPAATA